MACSEGRELCSELFKHLWNPVAYPEIVFVDGDFESDTLWIARRFSQAKTQGLIGAQ